MNNLIKIKLKHRPTITSKQKWETTGKGKTPPDESNCFSPDQCKIASLLRTNDKLHINIVRLYFHPIHPSIHPSTDKPLWFITAVSIKNLTISNAWTSVLTRVLDINEIALSSEKDRLLTSVIIRQCPLQTHFTPSHGN